MLVEGNTDALMAHQQGFENVVCTMGTALTAGQVELLTRYAPRIALAYDVDAAGQGAATFGATELTALVGEIERSEHKGRLTDVDVVRLPEGRDPDEVIRDDPGDVARARPSSRSRSWSSSSTRPRTATDIRSVPGRERLVDAVLPTLRTITDPVRRDGYLQLLSRRSGVDERVLLEALARARDGVGGRQPGAHAGAKINLEAVLASPGALDPQAVERALEPAESSAAAAAARPIPALIPARAGRLTPEMLSTTPARELLRALAGRARAVRPDRVPGEPRADPRGRRPDAVLAHRPAAGHRGRAPPGARPEPADARGGTPRRSSWSTSAPSSRGRGRGRRPRPGTGSSRTSWSSSDSD